MTIQTISKNCFIIDGSITLIGAKTSIRSTIIKDKKNNITIISPIKFTDKQIQFIHTLGNVSSIIAPNVFHHLYLKNAHDTFPNAEIFIPKGLEKKVKLRFKYIEDNLSHWKLPFQTIPIKGVKKLNEFVFFHEEEKTLITTGLFFNIHYCRNIFEKTIWSILGIYKKCSHSRLLKLLINDKDAFIKSKKKLASLNAKNLILAHGEILLNKHDIIKSCLET